MTGTRSPRNKETYFTGQNLAQTAQEMRRAVEAPRRASPAGFKPGRSALLVLDMQAYFLETESHAYIPSAPAILPGIQSLVQAYQQQNLPVIFTRHANTPVDAGQMAYWWRELIVANSPLSGIVSQLDTRGGMILPKTQYDAFYGTSLETELLHQQVTQVVVSGVMTHLCCETTGRAAFVLGFQVFFLVDGTATYNQDFHRASLLNLSHGFATLSLVSEILAALQEAK